MLQGEYQAVATWDKISPAEESQILTLETLKQYQLLAMAVIKQAAADFPRYFPAQLWLMGKLDTGSLRFWCEVAGISPYQLKSRCNNLLRTDEA